MKIVAILGSPFRGGNSDLLLDQAIKGCKDSGAKGEKIWLAEQDLVICDGCYDCHDKGKCVKHPGVDKILQKIKRADALIISTPIWWFDVSGYVKVLLDHFIALVKSDYSSMIKGKPIGIIATCGGGKDSGLEQALHILQHCFDFLECPIIGKVLAPNCSHHGIVKNRPRLLREAYKLGLAICQ